MHQAPSPSGLWPRFKAHLFGERASRLTEHASRAHLLSYLLIVSQSVAVVLVLGHAELPLLFSASLAIKALASMGLFVLIATVFASDMALLETLRRIPVLARNRQHGQLREHLLYVSFVLLVEGSTYAVVMAALDRDPHALVTAQPLIPDQGPVFLTAVILRAVLVAWTAVQLVIVRGKLPVLLSTLTATGKEIVGAHVERQLAALNIQHISLPAAFRTYAAMSKPPRRIRTALNGWLVRRELAQEAEEQRQVENIVSALEDVERQRQQAIEQSAPESSAESIAGHHTTQPPETPDRPPTGPGTPVAARTNTRKGTQRTPRPRVLDFTANEQRESAAQASASRSNTRPVRTPRKRLSRAEIEQRVRTVWQPGMSVSQLERATGISRSTASHWRNILENEGQAAQ